MRGLISETYLDDLRAKTHRGLTGQIERGYHAGGLSFGYRSVVAGVNPRGEPIGHRLEIDETQATIVREIFVRYAGGESCQRIAADLNARGVRGPRGGTWCVSALYGSPAKGAGVLNNELYIGRYVWNRSQWIKNPGANDLSGRKRNGSQSRAPSCAFSMTSHGRQYASAWLRPDAPGAAKAAVACRPRFSAASCAAASAAARW